MTARVEICVPSAGWCPHTEGVPEFCGAIFECLRLSPSVVGVRVVQGGEVLFSKCIGPGAAGWNHPLAAEHALKVLHAMQVRLAEGSDEFSSSGQVCFAA